MTVVARARAVLLGLAVLASCTAAVRTGEQADGDGTPGVFVRDPGRRQGTIATFYLERLSRGERVQWGRADMASAFLISFPSRSAGAETSC